MNESMYFLLKMQIFQCHVSFRGCIRPETKLALVQIKYPFGVQHGFRGELLVFREGICFTPWTFNSLPLKPYHPKKESRLPAIIFRCCSMLVSGRVLFLQGDIDIYIYIDM